ncbi:hypothetical protein D3C72_1381080 [compost metagenome]
MPAAVVVGRVVERRDAVFLGPVGLEVAEGLAVEAADEAGHARVGCDAFQVLAVAREVAFLFPEMGDHGVVHPAVEGGQVAFDVDRVERERLAQPRDVAAVHGALRLGGAQRMALALRDDEALGEGLARLRQPGARPLPEGLARDRGQRALGQRDDARVHQPRAGRQRRLQRELPRGRVALEGRLDRRQQVRFVRLARAGAQPFETRRAGLRAQGPGAAVAVAVVRRHLERGAFQPDVQHPAFGMRVKAPCSVVGGQAKPPGCGRCVGCRRKTRAAAGCLVGGVLAQRSRSNSGESGHAPQ